MPFRQLQFLMLVLLVALAGCQSIRPETPREGVAASYTTILSLAETVASARDAGYLDADQVARAKDLLQQAKDATDTAFSLIQAGEQSEGQSALERASTILTAVSAILEDYR